LFDLLSDIVYISTQSYALPILLYSSVAALVLPLLVFQFGMRSLVFDHLVFVRTPRQFSFWMTYASYVRENFLFETDALDEFWKLIAYSVFNVFKFILLAGAVIMAPVLTVIAFLVDFVMYVVFVVLCVHLKMAAVRPFMVSYFEHVEFEDNDGAINVYALNLAIFAEVVFESLPQIIVLTVNGYLSNDFGSSFFAMAVTGSVLSIINSIYPLVFYTVKYRSISKALEEDRFELKQSDEYTINAKTTIRIGNRKVALVGEGV
jgi:hypothetical protein